MPTVLYGFFSFFGGIGGAIPPPDVVMVAAPKTTLWTPAGKPTVMTPAGKPTVWVPASRD